MRLTESRDTCLIVVRYDEFLTLAYYNCESKIFKRRSAVPLTWTSRARRGRAAPVRRPGNTRRDASARCARAARDQPIHNKPIVPFKHVFTLTYKLSLYSFECSLS